MSLEKRDSLIIQYVADQFNMNRPYYKYDLKKQLTWLRNSTQNDYTLEVDYRDYHLKSFLFDALSRPPFAVEITNNKNEFVELFSFTDEDYYSENSISIKTPRGKLIRSDSIRAQKINLETNLNNLSRKLGIRKKNEMLEFTSAICYVLSMEPISQDSIQHEIRTYCSRGSLADDTIFNLVKKEQYEFFHKGDSKTLMVKTQSVFGLGYWRFWVDESATEPTIKAAFFSDILFHPYYM